MVMQTDLQRQGDARGGERPDVLGNPTVEFRRERLAEHFKQGFEADQQVFREMREFLQFFVGKQHMSPQTGVGGEGPRYGRWVGSYTAGGGKDVPKLRLTYNQIPRLVGIYVNEIMSATPSIQVAVMKGREAKATRLAELTKAVFDLDKSKTPDYATKLEEEAECFVVEGEVATKHFWDTSTGWLKEEQVAPCDLIRAPGAKSLEESPWLIHRNIYTYDALKLAFGADRARKLAYKGGGNENVLGMESYTVFSSKQQEYQQLDGLQILEFYKRPDRRYPKGYFVFFAARGILDQGELPGGIFPIVTGRCKTAPQMPRGHSFIREVRPYQVEINRSGSQDANNMAIFGDDKLITNASAGVQLGGKYAGISHLKVSGMGSVRDAIHHIPGAGMPKYMDYMANKIKEMDYVAQILTQMEKRTDGRSGDISFVLYSRIKDKRPFSAMARRFSSYLEKKARTRLALLRYYMTNGEIIKAGRREDALIVDDFRRYKDDDCLFKVEAASDAPETVLGNQMRIQQILQYGGEAIAKNPMLMGLIIKNMDIPNAEEMASLLTVDWDAWKQDEISLEKGLMPTIVPQANFEFKLQMLSVRMNRPDFQGLETEVQMLFHNYLQQCQQLYTQQQNEKLRLEQGMIPATGDLVSVDVYQNVPSASGGSKTVKMKLPYDTLRWVASALEKQGVVLESMNQLPLQTQINTLRGLQGAPQQLPS